MTSHQATLQVDGSIILRERSLASEGAIYALLKSNVDHLSPWVFWVNKDFTKERLHKDIVDYLEETKNGSIYLFDIFVNSDYAGTVDVSSIVPGKSAEIGYWLGEQYTGRGLATKCLSVLMDYVEQTRGVSIFYADIVEGNAPSVRVVERLGFTFSERRYNDRYKVWEARYVKTVSREK